MTRVINDSDPEAVQNEHGAAKGAGTTERIS